MRIINHIVLHCTATEQTTTVKSIQDYWSKRLEWKKPGYHFVIKTDGEIIQLLDIEEISNGVKNHNHDSINISYIGGIDSSGKPIDNRTNAQKESQLLLLRKLKKKYPKADILGHRDFPGVKKACPCFDVRSWLKEINFKA